MLLKDKIAVIAGDASGIGEAAASLFAREGAKVICIGDKTPHGSAGTMRIGETEVVYHRADITDAAQVVSAARACEKTLPKVDILFNATGQTLKKRFEETSEENWSLMLARNLTAGFLCSKHFLPLMKRAGAGAIVNHASIDAFLGNPGFAAYSAAKGGVIPLTHVMAHDLAKYNIRVNCISTGGIRGTAAATSTMDEARIAATPAKRMGTPIDVANVALFLASDMSAYVNGANIVVDGGRAGVTQGCFDD